MQRRSCGGHRPRRARPRRPPGRSRRRTSRGPCPGGRASSRAPRCRASSASRAAVRPGRPWSGAPIRPAGPPARSRTEQLRSPCGVFPFRFCASGILRPRSPSVLAPVRDLRRAQQGYLETVERQDESVWVTRMRWRMRGAWLWPTFVVLTVAEGIALELLPIAGDGPGGVRPGRAAGGLREPDRASRRSPRSPAAGCAGAGPTSRASSPTTTPAPRCCARSRP